MKICERAFNFVQIIDYKGTVRLCGWINNNIIGCLSDNTMEEIYHSERANELRKKLSCGDYSDCIVDACPYLAMNTIGEHLADIDEVPKYPEKLYLAFEEICNYKCISCTTPDVMCKMKKEEVERGYDIIEERLRDVMPYVKTISANGRGEFFVSRRILKLLSEWKPIAPKEEITVEIESNGSLFDEEHWKEIENIGQYNVRVAITVMSFDEHTYQILSGSKLPIRKIEHNLYFIKGLREKGIVNYFEIATVVQDRNFRALPEFTRRCVEEFGADYVRLRPYMPWGSQPQHIEWFMDIRNRNHPYYGEYRDMWNNPIFKHPKVHDWSGGLDSEYSTAFPYMADVLKKKILSEILLDSDNFAKKINLDMDKKIVIYGLGEVGKAIIKLLSWNNKKPVYIIDKYAMYHDYEKIRVYNLDEPEMLDKNAVVIVTPIMGADKIKSTLKVFGFEKVISIAENYQEEFR